MARAEHVCPARVNYESVNLLRYSKGIIDLDAEVPDTNAIFAATGKCLRKLPIDTAALKQRE